MRARHRRQDRPHLERADVSLTALDLDVTRLARVEENLNRLQLSATLIQGDAAKPDAWWDGQPFDRILATCRVPPPAWCGAIRHQMATPPRRYRSIFRATGRYAGSALATARPGGTLLYATCSLFKQENEGQVRAFLARHAGDADAVPFLNLCPTGRCCLMPSMMVLYALLRKT